VRCQVGAWSIVQVSLSRRETTLHHLCCLRHGTKGCFLPATPPELTLSRRQTAPLSCSPEAASKASCSQQSRQTTHGRSGSWSYLVTYTVPSSVGEILLASTPELTNPELYQRLGSALQPGRAGAWDAHSVGVCHAALTLPNGTHILLYAGQASEEGPSSGGIALSDDGRVWRRHPANPVLQGGGPHPGVSHWAESIKPTSLTLLTNTDSNRFFVAFDAIAEDPLASGGAAAEPGAVCSRSSVGGAVSVNLVTWSWLPRNPLLPPSTFPAAAFDSAATEHGICWEQRGPDWVADCLTLCGPEQVL